MARRCSIIIKTVVSTPDVRSSRGPAVSLRTNTIWAPPRAASVGKSFALLNANPAPTVKKLNKIKRQSETTQGSYPFRMRKYERSNQRPN